MMTTVTQRKLSRTLFAAALALAGTVTSFGLTAGPVHAQAPGKGYSASLATSLEAPRRQVVNGVVWKCTGDSCSAPHDGSRADSTCARVVRAFGPLTRFATPKGEFSAEDLQRCNAAA